MPAGERLGRLFFGRERVMGMICECRPTQFKQLLEIVAEEDRTSLVRTFDASKSSVD